VRGAGQNPGTGITGMRIVTGLKKIDNFFRLITGKSGGKNGKKDLRT
jgi:hypothetical protein